MTLAAPARTSPAAYVVALFGVRPLARDLAVSSSTVQRWLLTGLIPSKHHGRLLVLAKQRKLRLSPAELIG
jgi:hypothetical protein